MGNIYTVKSLAEEFGVAEDTVRSWIRKGKLVACKTSNRGGYLITEEDVDAFCEANDHYFNNEEETEEEVEEETDVTDEEIREELMYQNQMQIDELEDELKDIMSRRDAIIARLRVLYVIRETFESY